MHAGALSNFVCIEVYRNIKSEDAPSQNFSHCLARLVITFLACLLPRLESINISESTTIKVCKVKYE